jgi:hypothetical protein
MSASRGDATPWVTIRLTGAPRGARVIDLASRKEVARLPGEVRLPRSSKSRRFKVTHAGHGPRVLSITPEADQSRRIRLRPRGSKELPPNPFEQQPGRPR